MNYINKLYIVKEYVVLLAIGASFIFPNYAQQLSVSAETKSQITQIVSYLEYSLNVMGDAEMEIADKEVISNESYLRIFSYPNVQIEDDLSEHRSQPIYKNVQAYLRDISFFFQKAQFELKIISIEKKLNTENQPYYLVSAQQKINAITKSNQKFSSSKTRFIELNPSGQIDLKIVSIYSTKLLQVDDNIQWWDKLSNNWKKEFAKYITLSEGFTLANLMETQGTFNWKESYEWIDNGGKSHQLSFTKETWSAKIQSLFQIQHINLSGENFFNNIHPLAKFIYLEKVNLENTQVNNLEGLRNATNLKELYLTNTNIDNIEAISNLTQLEKLHLGNTKLLSLRGIENLFRLNNLNISNTLLSGKEISKIAHLKSLETLNISKCKISDFQFITGLNNLQSLDISSTDVQNLLFLSSSVQLERLWIENTAVASLEPLKELEKLQYIFCDGSAITRDEVLSFETNQPKCIVIFESDLLLKWWISVPEIVRQRFKSNIININEPTNQELHQIIKTKNLKLVNLDLETIDWLRYFTILEDLDLSQNPLKDINVLNNLKSLKTLNLSNTLVNDLVPIMSLPNLETLYIENTSISSLKQIAALIESLKILNIDNTQVSNEEAFMFQNTYSQILVIYKSEKLINWWNELPTEWQEIFQKRFSISAPTSAQLHKIALVTDFEIIDNLKITSLEPLRELRHIQQLRINKTNVTNIDVLFYLYLLKQLDVAQNPIQNFIAIGDLFKLEDLNMSSVRIKDISFLSQNTYLKSLNISNTQVKNLKPLANHRYLLTLDISNTPVVNLKTLKKLPLQKLICFNTKLKPKQIQLFKQQHPHCEVVYY